MSTQENVQIVKDFFAAMGTYNEQEAPFIARWDLRLLRL